MMNLRKMIVKYLQKITFIMVIIILVVYVGIQFLNEQRRERESSNIIFKQIQHLLEKNSNEIRETEEEYSSTCLKNAESIGYIIQYHPEALDDIEELKKIAEFSEIDEIHIFNPEGVIVASTNPEYYGLSVNDGEQIGYFKPMLKDKSLKLCQEITPNTAESKMMQYSALWSENGDFIVQIGMEPHSVMKAMEKNELSYIFSMLRVNEGISFFAIDKETGEIVGSTDTTDIGKKAEELGISFDKIINKKDGFHTKVKGVQSYCIFNEIDGNYVGMVVPASIIYQRIPNTVIGLLLCLVVISIVLIVFITRYMKKYVVNGIDEVNAKMREIAEGGSDETINVNNSQEFFELSTHINALVKSLYSSTEKISYVLNKTEMPIGVYEYSKPVKNVRFTEYISEILSLKTTDLKKRFADYKTFKEYMDKTLCNPVMGEDGVYRIPGEKEVYVKVEEITNNNEVLGVIMDVTNVILKRRQIEEERDIDILTGLYNRRGIKRKIAEMFDTPETLGYGAIIMIDADGLKGINDKYGHEKGDIYLRGAANILKAYEESKCISARYGGDEFISLFYGYKTEEELLKDIEGLKETQDNSRIYLADSVEVTLKFSLGYSLIKGRTDYDNMIKEADEKMYENKAVRKSIRK